MKQLYKNNNRTFLFAYEMNSLIFLNTHKFFPNILTPLKPSIVKFFKATTTSLVVTSPESVFRVMWTSATKIYLKFVNFDLNSFFFKFQC